MKQTPNSEFFRILKSVCRVIPTLAITATIGCLAAFVAGIAPDKIGIAVAVPLVGMFVIFRGLALVIPLKETPTPAPTVPIPLGIFAAVFSVAVIGVADLLFSAAVFYHLKQFTFSDWTLDAAKYVALSPAVAGFGCGLYVLFQQLCSKWSDVLFAALWGLLRYPTRIADELTSIRHHRI
jgi:hypothetical protein